MTWYTKLQYSWTLVLYMSNDKDLSHTVDIIAAGQPAKQNKKRSKCSNAQYSPNLGDCFAVISLTQTHMAKVCAMSSHLQQNDHTNFNFLVTRDLAWKSRPFKLVSHPKVQRCLSSNPVWFQSVCKHLSASQQKWYILQKTPTVLLAPLHISCVK